MIAFFYEFALLIFAVFFEIPKMLFLMWSKGKYRTCFFAKLGCGFPTIEKKGRQFIWIHAVSVGEAKAVVSLAKRLKEAPERPIVLISSASETGHADAKRSMPFADYHVFLPFDLRWIIKPLLARTKPDLIVLCETDLWYNFLKISKQYGASIVVVNAKISEKSKHRFQKISHFAKELFSLVDLFCVQSSHYVNRFEALGVDAKRLMVTGNIKFDDEHPPAGSQVLDALRKRLGLTEEDRVAVIGSTHEPEEAQLLKALEKTLLKFPELKVLVVPRHPERFDAVAELFSSKGMNFHRFSSENEAPKNVRVVLVDTMGLLRKCYQLASVAVVAGSFTSKVGGHNILEPLYYNVPTVFGPHMHGQPELVELVLEHQAGLQTDYAEIGQKIIDLFEKNDLRLSLIKAGSALVAESRGATNQSYDVIQRLLQKKTN